MNRYAALGITAAIVLIFGAIALCDWLGRPVASPADQQRGGQDEATTTSDVLGAALADITYRCDAGKGIRAVYYPHVVIIDLSDGRAAQLAQDSPADAGRYATEDGSFVFSNGTDGGAMLVEDGTTTYRGCLPASAATSSAQQ